MHSDGTFTWDSTGEPAVDSQAKFLAPPPAHKREARKRTRITA
jgi:hypothetical protein